jgi:hypothetical protein
MYLIQIRRNKEDDVKVRKIKRWGVMRTTLILQPVNQLSLNKKLVFPQHFNFVKYIMIIEEKTSVLTTSGQPFATNSSYVLL